MNILDIIINKKYCLILFIFLFNKNINFCCPFCCGFDHFNIINYNPKNIKKEEGFNLNKKTYKTYKLKSEEYKRYKDNKEKLYSSWGDEIFWKYFLGKLAVDLIIKKAEKKNIINKDEDKDIEQKINKIFKKELKDFVKNFFEEKSEDNSNKEEIKEDSEKTIFNVSLDDIIFFSFFLIENIYLNKDFNSIPLCLNDRKYWTLRNLCTFYLKPEDEIKNKYCPKGSKYTPTDIKQFFDKYIYIIKQEEKQSKDILESFNTICKVKSSYLMWTFKYQEDLIKRFFNCDLLNEFIINKRVEGSTNFDFDNLTLNVQEKFLYRFNNDLSDKDNTKIKKIIFKKDFLKELWGLYGQEVINSILEKDKTKTTNKTNLDIEKKKVEVSSKNNNEEEKNKFNIEKQNVKNKENTQKQFPEDKILKFEDLKIYVGGKSAKNSFLNGFLIGLLNYRTDLVNIFEKKIAISFNNSDLSWIDWLSEQNNSLENKNINFNDGFSGLIDSKGNCNQDLTYVDKYFCRMLLYLYKILSEENFKVIDEDFSNLKILTRHFFHIKKILKSVDGEFDVSAPDFYNTLFSFMEFMYQKFLWSQGIGEKKVYKIKKNNKINDRIKEAIDKEQNLIRLFFGFYYIDYDKNENVFLKHLYCGEVNNNKNITLDSLENLYSKKYIVVSYCSNLIVPIQIYSETNIIKNPQMQIKNKCKYKSKMILYPGYYSARSEGLRAKFNGCSFYMIDDFWYRNIYFNFSEVVNVEEKQKKWITNFINNKNIKIFLQKKYVTYFFVKKFDKEEKYDEIDKKYIPLDDKIKNNKNSLIEIPQEKWGKTNGQKVNKEASNDNKKNIDLILEKIRNFNNGIKIHEQNCPYYFVLPKKEEKENILENIYDWKSFLNIINNNGDILQEKKNVGGDKNINNIKENEENINKEGEKSLEKKLEEYIIECLKEYSTKITQIKSNEQNFVYYLLIYTNELLDKFIEKINGNINEKIILCSTIWDNIKSISDDSKPLAFYNLDEFKNDFNKGNLGNNENFESNVVEYFYNKWKDFMDGFPLLVQNSLLFYGLYLVLKNINDNKNDINQLIDFSKNLLDLKIKLFNDFLKDNKKIYKELIIKFSSNRNIEKKESINKGNLWKSLNDLKIKIICLNQEFNFKKKNIETVLEELKKYNKNDIEKAELIKQKEFNQLEKYINKVQKDVDFYLENWEKSKDDSTVDHFSNRNKKDNGKYLDVFSNGKSFFNSFYIEKKNEMFSLSSIQKKIKELNHDIDKIESGIDNLLIKGNTEDIMKKTFPRFISSLNNNGQNKDDYDAFQTVYDKFLKYYNILSQSYTDNKTKEQENTNNKEEEKVSSFRQSMINFLLDYILKLNNLKDIEEILDEQIKNNCENNEAYFKDLLFGLENKKAQDCFLNSSIQLLLRCWDCFEKIANCKNDDKEVFFTWLQNSISKKIWENENDANISKRLEISLIFMHEFFNFGEKVKEEKKNFLLKNNKITEEDAKVFHDKMYNQNQKLISQWRNYGKVVGNDKTFDGQSDLFDSLRLFFYCLNYVMYFFDKKNKPIIKFYFEDKNDNKKKEVEINIFYDNHIVKDLDIKKPFSLNIEKIEDLWKKDDFKKALLEEMPWYYNFFGIYHGKVCHCNQCKRISFTGTITCFQDVHIDDFMLEKKEMIEVKCEGCNNKERLWDMYNFFVPIGNYFFIGNNNAANFFMDNREINNYKKLDSWKDNIYKFGEENSYRNIGIGLHSGGVGEDSVGHYWAYIRSKYLNNLYFECNDEKFPYNNPLEENTSNDVHERIYLFEKINNNK